MGGYSILRAVSLRLLTTYCVGVNVVFAYIPNKIYAARKLSGDMPNHLKQILCKSLDSRILPHHWRISD
jgi:hypothetical protein